MTTYAFPDWHMKYIIGFELTMLSNVQENRSRLNLASQTVEFPGDSWVCGIEYRGMPLYEFYAVRAFWLQLRGAAHRVRIWPLDHGTPAGSIRGAPTAQGTILEGANQFQVLCNSGGTILAGDFFNVSLTSTAAHKQLVMVTNYIGAGPTITITITPPLRRNVAASTPLVWNRPYVDMMLTESPRFESAGGFGEGFTVQMVEVPMR